MSKKGKVVYHPMKRPRPRGPRPAAPPADVGLQQLTGTPPTVTDAGGTVWKFGFCAQDAKGALEELIRAHTIRDALKMKRLVGGVEGQAYWDERNQLLKSGHFRTFAPGWADVLKTPEGVVLFLQSLLVLHQPEVTFHQTQTLFFAEPEQVTCAIDVIAPDFFEAVAIQLGVSPADARKGAQVVAAAVVERTRATTDPTTPDATAAPPTG